MQLEALKSLALSVAAARSPESVLREMVQGLGMWEGVALARVWLLRNEPGEAPYLELKASVGASVVDPSKRWNRTDGGQTCTSPVGRDAEYLAARIEAHGALQAEAGRPSSSATAGL